MMLPTSIGIELDSTILANYLHALINLFFKILPIWESGENSLETYMKSLQSELLGCKGLIKALDDDSQFLSLVCILQYLIDNPSTEVTVVKREVFRAISICNKLSSKYSRDTKAEVV